MITQYKCSYCSKEFMDKDICEEHEKRHAKESEFTITKMRYDCVGDTMYPHYILLSFTDLKGNTHTRVYSRENNRVL